MSRSHLRMPSPQGVAAGQTATFKLPIGNRFHNLQLVYSGVTLTEMTEIRVYVNGRVIQRLSGAERDAINQFDGLEASNGILVIPFDRNGLRTLKGQEQTALNTGSFDESGKGIASFYVEIDIASGATAPEMSMFATVSDKIAGGAGMILHTLKYSRDPAGAGLFDISDIPRGTATTLYLNRVFFKKNSGTGTVDKVFIERDQVTLFERSSTLNTRLLTNGVRTPQNDYFAVDRTEDGSGGDPIVLAGANDFRYKLEVSGALNLSVITETLGSVGD